MRSWSWSWGGRDRERGEIIIIFVLVIFIIQILKEPYGMMIIKGKLQKIRIQKVMKNNTTDVV